MGLYVPILPFIIQAITLTVLIFCRDVIVSVETQYLLRELMELDQRKRLTALAAAETTQSILSRL